MIRATHTSFGSLIMPNNDTTVIDTGTARMYELILVEQSVQLYPCLIHGNENQGLDNLRIVRGLRNT